MPFTSAKMRENVYCEHASWIPDDSDDEGAVMALPSRSSADGASHASRLEALEYENNQLWQRVQRAEGEVQAIVVFLVQWGYGTQ